jgi:enolase-phosphatase E1
LRSEPASYDGIAKAIGLPAETILFLSDHPDELDAAGSAGWSVIGVARSGEPNSPRRPHRWINSFAEVDPRQP